MPFAECLGYAGLDASLRPLASATPEQIALRNSWSAAVSSTTEAHNKDKFMATITTPTQLAIDGGSPVRDTRRRPWPRWPVYDDAEEQALLRVLHSGLWWSVPGSEGKSFEQEFAEFHDAAFGVACANGTVALEVALRALGIGCGDEVIVPAYTFVATASAVLGVGALPIFVDIEPDTLNMDPNALDAAVTPRTAAVIPVHIAGRPADMDAILAIAARHRLAVIEDSAQAHAAAWRGKRIGGLGILARSASRPARI